MRARTYDNDPDRPDDGPVCEAPRFTIHASDPATPRTLGTDTEAEAFIRINTQRNRERAAAWCRRNGIELEP